MNYKPTIICHYDGKVELTEEEYKKQIRHASSSWICPICGSPAHWDDDCLDECLEKTPCLY